MFENIKSILKKTEEYVEINADLVRLRTIRSAADTMSYMFSAIMIIGALFLFFLLFFIGLSILIGHYIDSLEYGFFITAGFMALVCLIMYLCRKFLLRNPFCNLLIKKILG